MVSSACAQEKRIRTRAHSTRFSGQATIEYVLMISVVIAVSLGIYRGFYDSLRQGFLALNAELEKSLQTGNFPENNRGWDNTYN